MALWSKNDRYHELEGVLNDCCGHHSPALQQQGSLRTWPSGHGDRCGRYDAERTPALLLHACGFGQGNPIGIANSSLSRPSRWCVTGNQALRV